MGGVHKGLSKERNGLDDLFDVGLLAGHPRSCEDVLRNLRNFHTSLSLALLGVVKEHLFGVDEIILKDLNGQGLGSVENTIGALCFHSLVEGGVYLLCWYARNVGHILK